MAKMEHTSKMKPAVVLEPGPIQVGHTEVRHSINEAQSSGTNQSFGESILNKTSSSRTGDEDHAMAGVQLLRVVDTRGNILCNIEYRLGTC